MKKVCFILFLVLSQLSFSQTVKSIDSLNKKMWEIVFTQPDTSIQIAEKSIRASKKINYQKGLAEAKAKMAVAYDLKGFPETALPYFLDAIKIQETIKDSSGLAFSYNNLGLMYYAQYTYPLALQNINRSLLIDEALGNKKNAAGSLINLGIIYTYIDSMQGSIRLYNKALKLYSELKDSAGIMVSYSNMAKVYYSKKEYNKALEYNLINEQYLLKKNEPERLSPAFNSLAYIYLKLKNYNKALEYGYKDLTICSKYKLANRRQFAYEALNEIYKAMGNYEKAHEFLQNYSSLRDSILNENRNSSIAEMQTKYETEKKDKELLKINLEKENEITKNKTQTIFLIVSFIIFSLIIGFGILAYRSKQKINTLLQEKNKLNEDIISQKETMMGEIHHRVKNNLQLINSIIDLESRNFNNEQTTSLVGYIQKRVSAISLLHQFLYEKGALDNVNMSLYLEQLCEGLKKSFNFSEKEITILCKTDNIRLDVNTSVPLGLIVNELVTNSFKHGFANVKKGLITIRLWQEEKSLILVVEDNGRGIENDTSENNSFGVKMIRSLCRQLNAEWQTTNDNGLKNKLIIKKFTVIEPENI